MGNIVEDSFSRREEIHEERAGMVEVPPRVIAKEFMEVLGVLNLDGIYGNVTDLESRDYK